MVKSESEPISESELEEETDIEEEIQKFQYGEQRSHRKEQDAKNKDGIGRLRLNILGQQTLRVQE